MLAAGRLHDAGTAALDGRPVRRLTGTRSRTFAERRYTAPVTYYVDPTTSAPVRALLGLPFPSKVPLTERLDFLRFERLPLTAANAELLKVHPRPGADVTETRARDHGKPAERAG
jgi:hypothetical protein